MLHPRITTHLADPPEISFRSDGIIPDKSRYVEPSQQTHCDCPASPESLGSQSWKRREPGADISRLSVILSEVGVGQVQNPDLEHPSRKGGDHGAR
jgi:hypothetical protein